MKSHSSLAKLPSSASLRADDILEFHAARILLLLRVAGIAGRIDGLTKMAKLDFFVRYPEFFEKAARHLRRQVAAPADPTVESSMIRFHYGPWDKRYYHILAYLESKALIEISDFERLYRIQLTDAGKAAAEKLRRKPSFKLLANQMKAVKLLLGGRSGSSLKNLVYEVFDAEVARRPLGTTIDNGNK